MPFLSWDLDEKIFRRGTYPPCRYIHHDDDGGSLCVL
jgi:hypothetical protein